MVESQQVSSLQIRGRTGGVCNELLPVMPTSAESLLQLLQRLTKHPTNQIKQVHSLLLTGGHLLPSPKTTPSNLKYHATLLFNALIKAYLHLNHPHNALLLFTQMLSHRSPPNPHTFPPLIKAIASSPYPLSSNLAKPVHAQAIKRGASHDPFVQTSFLNLYARLGDVWDARGVFDEMPEPCIVACNAMLDGFCRNGDMGSALGIFERMAVRDVVSWTTLINGYTRNGRHSEAILCFEKMMAGGAVTPNEATFVCVLSSCCNSNGGGALYRGRQVHGYIIKNVAELTVFMGTALVDLYGKMGCLGYAVEVFSRMEVKEVCTWNTMMSSLALNGMEKQAVDMFEMMRTEGLHPNEVTFVAILSACARAELVDLGLELFHSMLRDFGIVPRMEHYGCVVDLLGRAGLLREAASFMSTMPFEPDASVMGALLGACKVHSSTELANKLARWMLKSRLRHCGQYVLLSTLYAGAEMWDHAVALRKAMAEDGIQKIPAYSMIS